MKTLTRIKAFILAIVMTIGTFGTTAFAAESSESTTVTTESKNGITSTVVEFTLDDDSAEQGIMPYLWDTDGFDYSSGSIRMGGTRTFDDGNYLGFEVSLTPIGTQSSSNQRVYVNLYKEGALNKSLGLAYANTRSSDSKKADWIPIDNNTLYRFGYSSVGVNSQYPVRVTVTFYTWN